MASPRELRPHLGTARDAHGLVDLSRDARMTIRTLGLEVLMHIPDVAWVPFFQNPSNILDLDLAPSLLSVSTPHPQQAAIPIPNQSRGDSERPRGVMQTSPNDRGHVGNQGSPRLEGSLLHAQESIAGIRNGATQAGRPKSTTASSSDSATLADGTHRPDAAAAAATASGQFRPTSYLFEGRDATPTPAIPELQRLTVDVPPRNQISIILGPFFIIFGDLVIPCIVYYVWLGAQPAGAPRYNKDILGFAILPFGLGELYILVVRVWRLIKYYDECAPLLSRHKWELDATSWIYAAALLAALVPFVVGSERTIPQLYLYAPGIYMAFLLSWALFSLIPFKTPVRIDSEPRGHRMRPLVFYAAEDFFAVDGWQKKEFRVRYRQRYDSSIMFQKMIFELTVWWCSGIFVYIGCLSAIIWNTEFEVAFGLSLGLLFSFIISWAIMTYIYIQVALERERNWWINKKSTGEKP
ncbi:hypothetical protein diail_5850 [Diaporthe ilicicola]|nr:hypothetical protein diail_5850 [Diaporthe ilicicola]